MLSLNHRGLFVLVFGRVLQVGIMLASIKLSTHYLTAVEIGNLYVIVTITNFFGLFLINPLGQYVNRCTHVWYAAGELVNRFFIYNFYVVGVAFLSFCVVSILPLIDIAGGISHGLLLLVVPMFVYVNTWNQTLAPALNMLGHRVVFTTLTVASAALAVLLSFFAVTLYEPTGIMWVSGQVSSFFLLSIVSFFFLKRYVPQPCDIGAMRAAMSIESLLGIVRFTLPLAVSILFLWMQGQSYRFVIERFVGLEFLGYFGVGFAIAIAVSSSVENLMMQWISPALYRSMADSDRFSEFFSVLINGLLPLYFLLAIFVSFLSVNLMVVLVGEAYSRSCIFLVFGIWAEFFRVATNLLATVAHSKMCTRKLVVPYAVGGIGTLLGVYFASRSADYYILIPSVIVVMGGVGFAVMYYQMNKILKIRLRIAGFLRMFVFGTVFSFAYFLYSISGSTLVSALILSAFGFYFLMVVYFYFRALGGARALEL
ncbi:lipopolysaccharide biosynthesis protein [Pseudomonas sp. ENNP23]|uniref:lipopolysaccharide biosynthesis protein n=1 Tax=Pseudomonas sp. ENNP23 TaxID=1535636 RepID=UPI001112FE8F|nr:hypothetical protein [Pseudomonas sp. ENNP23]